jgi:hypothetical protein
LSIIVILASFIRLGRCRSGSFPDTQTRRPSTILTGPPRNLHRPDLWSPLATQPVTSDRTLNPSGQAGSLPPCSRFHNEPCFLDRSHPGTLRTLSLSYWMISSARASTEGGIVRPICFAAFRLMMNSNFVGCSMGRSAGLAPLRILSTNVAARRSISLWLAP